MSVAIAPPGAAPTVLTLSVHRTSGQFVLVTATPSPFDGWLPLAAVEQALGQGDVAAALADLW